MRILDLDLLLYAVDREAPDHGAASARWDSMLSGNETVGLAWTVLLGFVRLTTNPRVVRSPMSSAEALDYVHRWQGHPVTTVVDPTKRHAQVLRDLLGGTAAGGNLMADAHLAALAIEHGTELCSADRDFGRFPGLRWTHPLSG